MGIKQSQEKAWSTAAFGEIIPLAKPPPFPSSPIPCFQQPFAQKDIMIAVDQARGILNRRVPVTNVYSVSSKINKTQRRKEK